MHIPDGFLNIPVSAGAAALSIGAVSLAVKKVQKTIEDRLVPLMGVLAAFIFAAQMFNFPVAGGTSGHLLGGMLAVVVVGPWAAMIVLTCVLIVQCLLFQDGGLLALGANVLNMAVIGVLCGWVAKKATNFLSRTAAIFIGSWISVVAAAAAAAAEMAISDTAPFATVLVAMVSVHAIIGTGEGVITILVVSFLKRVKPEIVEDGACRAL